MTAAADSSKGSNIFRHVLEILLLLGFVSAFTAFVVIVTGAPPLAACYHLFMGSLGSWVKFTHVVKAWIPLTLCACGLLFTFRIGLWNIGVEGQLVMGSVFATGVLRMGMENPGNGTWWLTAALAASAIGGAAWAGIAGLLKTKGGVNEIFAGLGLNFVAQAVVLWLIFGPWKQPGVASMSGTETFPAHLWLQAIPELRISPTALLIVASALIVTGFLLGCTRIGLHLKAVGSNPFAAVLFGLRPALLMLVAMLFGGGFAGIAGNIQVTSIYHRLIPSISSNYGYLALLVVMLANYNIWLIAPVAFFFACLNVGSIQLPMMLQLDSSLGGVIQGALVLATLGVHAWHKTIATGNAS
jgi:simple sugar transport system permease protein